MSAEAKIFISYSRRNRDFAERLFNALRARHYDPWVDFDDIPFSVDWWVEIKDAIDRHDVVIFLVSDHSLMSRVCNEEITYARERNKRIIPLIVDDVDIKHVVGELYDTAYEMAARDNWSYIRTLNWIYFYRESDDFEKGIENIISTLETDHNHLRNHTRILTRALEWEEYQKGRGFLLRGEELSEAEEWLAHCAGKNPLPLPLHREYIKTSRQVQEEEEAALEQMQRQTRLARRASIGLIVTAIVVISGILLVLRESIEQARINQARSTAVFQEQATVIAELDTQSEQAISLRLAVEAQSEWESGNDSLLALPLGLAAFNVIDQGEPPLRVQRIVSEAVYSPGLLRFLVPGTPPPEDDTCALPGPQADRYSRGKAHTADISSVLLADEAARIVTSGLDSCVYVWDIDNGDLLTSLAQFDSRVTALALAPDESMFAVGDGGGHITLWSIDGEPIASLAGPDRHEQRITSLAFSYDSRYLFSGSLDERTLLWDVDTTEPVLTLDESGNRITAVGASPNALTFMSGDTEGRLILWDLDTDNDNMPDALVTGNPLPSPHTRAVTSITFSDSGQQVLSTALDDILVYWTNPSLGLFSLIETEGDSPIQSAHFLENRYAAVANEAGDVTLWDLTQGQLNDTISLPSRGSLLQILSVSGSGQFAAAGFDDGSVMVLELDNGAKQQQLALHRFPVQQSVVQADGTVVSRELNEDIVLWEPGTTDITRYTNTDLGIDDAVLHPQGAFALAYDAETFVTLQLDLETLDPSPYPDDDGFINNEDHLVRTIGTVFSQAGNRALSPPLQDDFTGATALFSEPSILWDTASGEVLNPSVDIEAMVGTTRIGGVLFNADGTRLVVVVDNSEFHIFDMDTLEPSREPIVRARNIQALAFGAPGYPDKIVTGYADGSVGFFDLEREMWIDVRGHNAEVSSIDLRVLDGTLYAATTAADQTVLLWDVFAHQAIRQFQPRTRGSSLVNFGVDGDVLITQSADLYATVWRLDETDEIIQWAQANRYVPNLSELDCDAYQIPAPCGEEVS